MKTVSNKMFDELFKISVYRDITEQLREHGLITDHEYDKIIRRIDATEDDLIKPAAKPNQHQRNNAAV